MKETAGTPSPLHHPSSFCLAASRARWVYTVGMDALTVKNVTYLLTSVIRKEADSTLYNAYAKGELFTLERFYDEGAFSREMERHETLAKAGINVSKLIIADRVALIIIRRMIIGRPVIELLAEGDLSDEVIADLFELYRAARFAGIGLDYLPENFVLAGRMLFYTGSRCGKIDPAYNVENYALRYWLHGEEGAAHLKEAGYEPDPTRRILTEEEVNKRVVLLTIAHW